MSWSGWSEVGGWIKDNIGGIAGLAGSVLTGNVPGGIAAVASMVTEATGEEDPKKALDKLKMSPDTRLKFEELAKRDEADIRQHHREMLQMKLEDQQEAHKEQQETIREGDKATDQYVRRTRPKMAKQSWWATAAYLLIMEILQAFGHGTGANMAVAGMLASPAWAYMGFRTIDKVKGKEGFTEDAIRSVIGGIKGTVLRRPAAGAN